MDWSQVCKLSLGWLARCSAMLAYSSGPCVDCSAGISSELDLSPFSILTLPSSGELELDESDVIFSSLIWGNGSVGSTGDEAVVVFGAMAQRQKRFWREAHHKSSPYLYIYSHLVGNLWDTKAAKGVGGQGGIDMFCGPSCAKGCSRIAPAGAFDVDMGEFVMESEILWSRGVGCWARARGWSCRYSTSTSTVCSSAEFRPSAGGRPREYQNSSMSPLLEDF